MPTVRNRTPNKLFIGCTQCGQKDPAQFYASSNWCKRCHKGAVHKQRLKAMGLTVEDLARIAEAQGNCCAICKRSEKLFGRSLHADHNHDTKQARGLLCGRCNQVLGRAHEDPALLRAMADYLDRYRVQ